PKSRVVEMVAPLKFSAKLQEPAIDDDPTSAQQSQQLPTYNAYSADGDVTAPLVYVNYGIPSDYEELDRLGISVKGAIVIARYGASWRGIKPKVAAEHGAVGCIIYSDPREDGYFRGDVFPKGAYRNSDGVQRGSVMDMPIYPGDPLTPGVGATKDAKRLDIKDVKVFTKIPVLPISYGDAQPLLENLGGPVAPESWRGALPLTYHIGPGPAKVHLVVASNWDLKPVYDVIAKITGSEYPDEWVIRGNHQDAWVNGAEDPVSGISAELEEARALGELHKEGWKPQRTIIYCAWDGEEEGLLGSTEWVEAHADELTQKAVLYINSDSNGRGYLGVGGSHTLEKFINAVAHDIEDPEKGIPVWKRSQLLQISRARLPEDRAELRHRTDLRIGALGSGSDYTAFLDHLGIASLDLGYGGEDGGGIYHSVYDDFYWYTHFSDKDFAYGGALAQTCGTAVLRIADNEILPFDFGDFTDTIQKYLSELKKLQGSVRDDIREKDKEIQEGVFTATADPQKISVPPSKEEVPPYLNFTPLENAVEKLVRSTERFSSNIGKLQDPKASSLSKTLVRDLNKQFMLSERVLTSEEGLPGRPWFRHLVYAPGMYTGYGVKTIPGVREAIEQKNWKEADTQIARAAKAFENETNVIDSANADIEKVTEIRSGN
ncbi:MAG TPA: transferrin receptor-like dimerization domain-containing protein, partial [Bacteroidota bacterium]|nr:transferrin receptor-like dimerization domain-containing protein [Bacteroidota bacterium]